MTAGSGHGLEARLRAHVQQLAGEIGVRNVFRPQALQAAERYIRSVWSQEGWPVQEETYPCQGVRSANLQVRLEGADAQVPIADRRALRHRVHQPARAASGSH